MARTTYKVNTCIPCSHHEGIWESLTAKLDWYEWSASRRDCARYGDEIYAILEVELLLARVHYAISSLCLCSCSINSQREFPSILYLLGESVSLCCTVNTEQLCV